MSEVECEFSFTAEGEEGKADTSDEEEMEEKGEEGRLARLCSKPSIYQVFSLQCPNLVDWTL